MEGTVTFVRELRFDQPPERVWPLVSNTNLINELVNSPAYTIETARAPDGTLDQHGRVSLGPIKLTWDEEVVEWIRERRLSQRRVFRNGPVKSVEADIELAPDGAGSRFTWSGRIGWRGPIGALLRLFGVFQHMSQARVSCTERLVKQSGLPPTELGKSGRNLIDRTARGRFARLVTALRADPDAHSLADRLADHLRHAPASAVRRIRPLALARAWQVEPDAAVGLCLAAQRQGLLTLAWDLLCPRCRGAKAQASRLDDLPRGTHCPSCNIDYDRNFHRNVELTFRAARWLRAVPEGEFCLMGTSTSPHIMLQVPVGAGAERSVALDLPPGPYRFRTLDPGGDVDVTIDADGRIPAMVVAGDTVTAGPSGPPGTMRLRNEGPRPRRFVVEDRRWTADALTGDQVIAMPAFRRLCPEQLLRPGDDAEIGRVTIMFTDLKGSTAMYGELGDAVAYRLVRDHFAYLAERIQSHRGAVVKTVGDAVMAAFQEAPDAVRAALAAQADVAAFNADHAAGSLVLKIAMHEGPCIAVTTAGVLDYFGGTVNVAARLVRESLGGDVVASAAVLADPEVAPLLAGCTVSRETATLRGVAEPVGFGRLVPAAGPQPAVAASA